ncbi:hypothetical protein HAHE_30860 [Haloferula helveola]|uniref:Thioredoxin domain-containing protein n=1 Tax=Haloferula helveola TaxID=490095 RepID=A0ABM7RMS0_9BACT|nr:hypothetical protein HAHE_30860 [Haloferula helveola]
MNPKVIAIYGFVVVASIAMILFFRQLGKGVPETELPPVSDAGVGHVDEFFPIEEDLDLVKQDGTEVKLSDLKGKVTVLAQFFAVCPKCAVRNGSELAEIYKTFGDDPDFRIVCITVDPDEDDQEKLSDYAETLGADPENWWFASAGDRDETHRYLEEELKFFKIRERRDPIDIASNGRYAHDLGFLLIDHDLNVVGKWPLADADTDEARERDPGQYDREKKSMYDRIRKELSENP